MYMLAGVDHRTRARDLVRRLLDEQDRVYGVGSMGVSVYDTAWLSMVTKDVDGQQQWLFLDSFIYLLKVQDIDGGWHAGSSQGDDILGTMAALLALCKHINIDQQLPVNSREDLFHRRNRAIYYLDEALGHFHITSPLPAGFEVLVPKHLELLSNEGIDFNFPSLEALLLLKQRSAHFFDARLLYNETRCALAECLEGFVGDIDFAQMHRHKISGSIMSSPSATAAYLIHSSEWDDESEAYLRHVVSLETSDSAGGVPPTYPSTVFEISQVLTTLLGNGFKTDDLGNEDLQDCCNFLNACLSLESGTTGSAPYMESDACNTSRAMSLLAQIGRKPSPQGLLIRFQTQDCFKMLTHERKPSFDANCYALKALLDLAPQDANLTIPIEKAVKFITNYWWTTNCDIECSENKSSVFTLMTMADALTHLLRLWRKAEGPMHRDPIMKDKVYICLYEALSRVLRTQTLNGSWGNRNSLEETAYAVITLAKLAGLSSAARVRAQVIEAIERGRSFLVQNFAEYGEQRMWNGKIARQSRLVTESFILAALEAPTTTCMSGSVESYYDMPIAKIAIQTKYLTKQAWLTQKAEWQIQACLVESYIFLEQLKSVRFDLLPQDQSKHDQYFEMLPFVWLAANNLFGRLVAPEYVYQMMLATMLGRQMDDYLQQDVAPAFVGCVFEVEDLIEQIFESIPTADVEQSYCDTFDPASSRNSTSTTATTKLNDVRGVLTKFITHFLTHPYVIMTSAHDQRHLREELSAFLVGRVREFAEESAPNPSWEEARESGITANPSSHSYRLAFLCCLVGNQTTALATGLIDFFESPEQQYLASAMCRHLSTIETLTTHAPPEVFASPKRNSPARRTHEFSWQTHRSQGSSVSSISGSSISSFGNGGISPGSVASSQSSAPGISPLSEHFKRSQSPERDSRSARPIQFIRLVSHERRCLEMCVQSLELANPSQQSTNVVGMFLNASDLCAQVLNDPNIGSYCQAQAIDEPQEKHVAFELAACPAGKNGRKGSVSRARAGLEVTPQMLEPTLPMPEVKASIEAPAKVNNVAIARSAPPHITEFSFDFPMPTSQSPVSTTPSIEMSRIEQIMAEMGQGGASKPKPASSPARSHFPKPKSNATLYQQQSRVRAATGVESIYSLAPRKDHDALRRFNSTPTLNSFDTEAARLAKARLQTQRRICDQLDRQLEKDRKLELKRTQQEQSSRSGMINARGGLQPVSSNETITTRIPLSRVRKAHALKVRFEDEEEKEKQRLEKQGWVKSPDAEKICVSLVELDYEDGNGKKGKLRRRRGTTGPKLKLPF